MEQRRRAFPDSIEELRHLRNQALVHRKVVERLYRQVNTVRSASQVMLRVKTEAELLKQTCELLEHVGGFKYAWVGFVDEGSSEIKPVAQAGFEEAYLSAVKFMGADSSDGNGATGMWPRLGGPLVVRNIADDPAYQLRRQESWERGYASVVAVPLVDEERLIGVLYVCSEREDAFGDEEVGFLMDIASQVVTGLKNLEIRRELRESSERSQQALSQTVQAILSMLEAKDPYTATHSRRVAELACAIAGEMGLPEESIHVIRLASIVHDIGKINLPAELLGRPTRLNPVEFNLIKTHSQIGHDILKTIDFPWPLAQIVLQHHERTDGSGYPLGLSGEDILLEARITGVADVVEAMASHRPYRPALGIEKALEEISNNKGILYDPQVVDACLRLFTEKGFAFA